MTKVNMHEAKTNLSKLVEAVESGREPEIILARNGKPVARIVPIEQVAVDTSKRIGIADGEFGDFDFDEFQALDEVVWAGVLDEPIQWEPPKFGQTGRKKSA